MQRTLALLATALSVLVTPVAASAQVRLPVAGVIQLAQAGRTIGTYGSGSTGSVGGGLPARSAAPQGQVIGTERAVTVARGRAGGGVVLDAGLAGANYRVRIRTADGRVIDFIIDARSGAVLSSDGD